MLALAASLLCVAAVLVLTLLLAWLPLGGGAHSPRVPASARDVRSPAGGATSSRPIVVATEATATPSRGEPTDVVPSSSSSSTVQAPGTVMPTASATPTPTPPPTAASTAIEITCADAINNISGEVCVHTTPGAAISISVTYCNGLEARNTDLQGTRYADSDGNYTWSWVPETTCPGTANIHVTANGTGGSSDATAPVTVSP